MPNEKTLLRFNIKNAKYALKISSGYETPVPFGYSDSISLEADYSEKVIYGDGRKVLVIPNDKGKTGTLSLLTIDEAYEIAMKRRLAISGGIAEVKQLASVEHAIYFETDYLDSDNKQQTAKTIIYGVTSGRPSESYNQTTDDINNNNVSYPLTITGTALKASSGTSDYTDAGGNKVYVWQQTCLPTDTGYANFGTTIADPKAST